MKIQYTFLQQCLKQTAYGSRISFKKDLTPLVSNRIPGAFDYAAYASQQGIYHQVYLSAGSYTIDPPENAASAKRLMFDWREAILRIINRYIPGKKEAGLAEALLVGYKDNLDKDLIQSYSDTGVVHVIAISGLHLGLIYLMLSLVLKPFGRKKMMRWVRPLFIVTGLWIFSIIAGSSPSVLRSAVMFTFIVVGELGAKKTPILNSLSASAFLLLCYKPAWLFDAGFQLSYIAVLSLVLFMRPVYNSLYVENKLLDMGWQLSAVTIAAQILTTPLSVYLFHQFPVYFLITNLVCIPLSSLILIAELILCAISFLPALASITGESTAFLIRIMNGFIRYMEKIPGGKLQMLQADFFQVVLLYLLVIAISLSVTSTRKVYLYFTLVLLIFFSATRLCSFYTAQTQLKLMVLNANGRMVDVIKGRNEWLIADKNLITDPALEKFQLKPARIVQRIASTRYTSLDTCGNVVIQLKRKKIFLINQPDDHPWDPVADLFIIGKETNCNEAGLLLVKKGALFIFDGSVTGRKLEQWKSGCDAAGIQYWAVKEKGAFVLSLN